MSVSVTIRLATCEDAEALVAIYAPYVLTTAITSEYVVPSVEEFAGRIETTLKTYPWLVAEADGVPVGYAYASRFKHRAAYDWSVELSIYVDQNYHKGGVGKALYTELQTLLVKQGVVNAFAWVSFPEVEDEYCTYNSFNFHTHVGFEPSCMITKVHNKFGRWYGLAMLQKTLQPPTDNPAPLKPVNEVLGE